MPNDSSSVEARGFSLLKEKKVAEASDVFAQLVKQSPLNCEAQYGLALACYELGDKTKARRLLELVRKLDPSHKKSRQKLVKLLIELNSPEDAGFVAAELLAIDDQDPVSIYTMALAEFSVGHWQEALESSYNALEASGNSDKIKRSVVPIFAHCDTIDNASNLVEDILTNDPRSKEGNAARASLFFRVGDYQGGIGHLLKCRDELGEDSAFDQSMTMFDFASGKLKEAWDGYARRPLPDYFSEDGSAPQPSSLEEIKGRSIYLLAEQGIGDIVQFIRFVKPISAVASDVHLLVRESLHQLLGPSLPNVALISDHDDPPECDFSLSLMNIPSLLGISQPDELRSPPYLFAEPDRLEKWANILGDEGFKVGLVWQGNPKPLVELGRSLPLSTLKPLSTLSGVRLVSLQMGYGVEQLESNQEMGIEVLSEYEIDKDAAFVDTAAIMKNLDLIVTTDTSSAHLAGALGCPTLLMLKKHPDWRWVLGGYGHVWYDSLTLINQNEPEDWTGVVAQVVKNIELRKTNAI